MAKRALVELLRQWLLAMGLVLSGAMLPLLSACGDDDDDATATDDDDDATATGDDDDATASGDDDDATATDDDDDDAPNFAKIQSEILNVSCVACHGGVVPRAGLDLSGAGAYDRLVNVKDNGTGLNYVTPGDAEASLLYKVLLAEVPELTAGSVQKMPQGGGLSQEKIDLMKAWIDGGAAR